MQKTGNPNRRFHLKESVGVEIPADFEGHSVTQFEIFAYCRTAEVQIAVFHAQVIAAVGIFLDGEWRGLSLVEHRDSRCRDFDIAGRHFGVFRFAFDDFAGHLDNPFAAKTRGSFTHLSRGVFFDDDLRNSVTVTEIDKCHGSEITDFLHPSGEGDLLVDMFGSQAAASVGSIHRCVLFCKSMHGCATCKVRKKFGKSTFPHEKRDVVVGHPFSHHIEFGNPFTGVSTSAKGFAFTQ